jgi:chitodextrinase
MKTTAKLKQAPQRFYLIIAVLVFGAVGAYLLSSSHASGNATLALSPASGNVSLGSTVTVTVQENSGTVAANSVEADLTYDQTKLQYVTTVVDPAFDIVGPHTGGAGAVSMGVASSVALTGQHAVAVVTFTAIGSGSTSLAFATSSGISDTNQTPILGSSTGATYTIADTAAPSVPTAITSSTQTATSINLSWTASTDNVGVTGYKIFRGGTQVGTSTTTSYNDSGLAPSNSYAYTVLAYDAANNPSAQSAVKSVSTLPDTTAPSVPTALTMSSHTLTSITLSWTASTDNVGVTGYKIFRGGTQIGTSTTTSYVSNGLAAGTSYGYTVAANDAAGNTSAQTASSAFSTLADTTAPSVPTGLTSPTQGTTTISLAWSASTDNVGVTGYKIFRGGTQIGTATGNTYTDTGLTAGTSYSYTISAYDVANNNSAQSAAAAFKPIAVPGDATGDGHVTYLDLSVLAGTWHSRTDLRADFVHDNYIDYLDLSVLASNWGK